MKITTKLSIGVLFLAAAVLVLSPLGAGAQYVSYYGQQYYSGYNARPVWNKVNNLSVVQGETVSVGVLATDDNGDALTYEAITLPANANFNPITRVFSMTPSFAQLGSFPVTLSVTDNKSAPVALTFYVGVTTNYGHYTYGGGEADPYFNQAPYFSSNTSYYAVNSGNELRFTVTAIDPEGDAVRYRVSELPAGASFDANTRVFSWTPSRSQRGTYTINFTAMDSLRSSVPFAITIVVDGGAGIQTLPPATTYYPSSNIQNQVIASPVNQSIIPKTAVAGQTYYYNFGSRDLSGLPLTVQLMSGPTGATIVNNVLTWSVPANIVNKEYPFSVRLSNGAAWLDADFTVAVSGGTPTVKTVYTAPKTTYVSTSNTQYVQQPVVAGTAVYVTAGRTVVPLNYQYPTANANYTANAYGIFTGQAGTIYGAPLPVTVTTIEVFNIAVRVSGDNETIVSWDTSKPTSGEVVFGYASQSRGSDLNRTILNYDFTTGVNKSLTTRHEARLGKLALNQTYYLRVIARADNQTEISREIVFIPMTNEQGSIIVNQGYGAASSFGALGSFLISGGFLFFLVLVIIGLIIYLLIIGRRAPVVAAHHEEIPLDIHHDHAGHSPSHH